MLFTNKLQFEFTPFTLLMALIKYVNGFIFTLCSLKAFQYVNLSVYSVYSMLGGMLLPILAGVLFYQEPFTWGLGICCLFTVIAVVLVSFKKGEMKENVDEEERKRKKLFWIALLCYIGVFVSNGMSGVLTKFYSSAPYEKASSAGYSLLFSILSIVISLVFVMILWKKCQKIYAKSFKFYSNRKSKT